MDRTEGTKIPLEHMSHEVLEADLENFWIIDVRSREEYQQCHIAGAQNIFRADFEASVETVISELRRSPRTVVLYCNTSRERAPACANHLLGRLHKSERAKVRVLSGGFTAWSQHLRRSSKARWCAGDEMHECNASVLASLRTSVDSLLGAQKKKIGAGKLRFRRCGRPIHCFNSA